MTKPFFHLAFLCAVSLTGPVLADVVVMKNGDRITGTVSRIWGNDLSIEPDYTDVFKIEVDKVASVESTRDYDLTLDDGRKVTAQLTGAAAGGLQNVVYDGQTHTVPVTDLQQVEEVKKVDWDAHIDWSGTLTSGNSESKISHLTGDSTVKIGDHRHIGTLLIADEEVAGVKTKNQTFLTYSYNWLFSDKWFFGAGASYETDPIKQLDHRSIVGAGIGRDIWDFHDRTMNFEVGLGTLDESLAAVGDTSTIAYWKFRFRYDLGRPDLEVYHNDQINTYLSGRDNVFAKSSTGLRYEITDLFYLTLSMNVDYEKNPPPGTKQTDQSWVIGAGFEF